MVHETKKDHGDKLNGDKLFCPLDLKKQLHQQLTQGNLSYRCPDMLVVLSRDVDPQDVDQMKQIPLALRDSTWEMPGAGLGPVTRISPNLADLLEVLESEIVTKVEVDDVYECTDEM